MIFRPSLTMSKYFLRPIDFIGGCLKQSKFLRYIVSGGTATFVHFIVLYLLTEYLQFWYVLSTAYAYLCGFCVSFVLQKWWTFKERTVAFIRRQASLHLLVVIFGSLLNAGILYVLVEFFDTWYIAGQVLASGLIAIANFFFYRVIFLQTIETARGEIAERSSRFY